MTNDHKLVDYNWQGDKNYDSSSRKSARWSQTRQAQVFSSSGAELRAGGGGRGDATEAPAPHVHYYSTTSGFINSEFNW
jgi:hypothetical protein